MPCGAVFPVDLASIAIYHLTDGGRGLWRASNVLVQTALPAVTILPSASRSLQILLLFVFVIIGSFLFSLLTSGNNYLFCHLEEVVQTFQDVM
jgi:hypothetical protein